MCPDVTVPHRAMPADLRTSGSRLVHPARLQDTQATWVFPSCRRLKQRDLARQRKFARKPLITLGSPEKKASWKWKEAQVSSKIGASGSRRQVGERLKREQVLDASKRSPGPQIRHGPTRHPDPIARPDAKSCLH